MHGLDRVILKFAVGDHLTGHAMTDNNARLWHNKIFIIIKKLWMVSILFVTTSFYKLN